MKILCLYAHSHNDLIKRMKAESRQFLPTYILI